MRDFSKIGFITSGDPNYGSSRSVLLAEVRNRIKDGDEAGLYLQNFFDELEEEGIKPNSIHEDNLADMLSDASPDEYVFELRTDSRGNSNYGYFHR